MADLNIKPNALFTNDNLFVLNGMNSECIDLIYLDPPFNSNRIFSAPVGSRAAGCAFKDMWKWDDVDAALLVRLTEQHPQLVDYITSIEQSHSRPMMAYIAYMAQRLFEMHRVLKPAGSIYLHCDQTAGHYLKIVMDFIFGGKNFRNEIAWCYPPKGKGPKLAFHRKHDVIFYYGKTDDGVFNRPYTSLDDKQIAKFSSTDKQGRRYKEFKGRRTYLDKSPGRPVPSWWNDIAQTGQSRSEYLGYPTQKPRALLERIIRASSNEGDVVLDPFCGCATTCVAAEHLQRRWIGIDLSKTSADLIRDRLKDEAGTLFNNFTHFTTLPDRRDVERMKPKDAKQILYGKQLGRCAGGKTHFPLPLLEVDHIIPKSKGGGDFLENYQLLCGRCNRIKGDRPMEYLLMVLRNREAQSQLPFGPPPAD